MAAAGEICRNSGKASPNAERPLPEKRPLGRCNSCDRFPNQGTVTAKELVGALTTPEPSTLSMMYWYDSPACTVLSE